MNIFILIFILLPGISWGAATLPGGGGSSAPAGSVVVPSGTSPCGNGEAPVSNGSTWACGSVSPGTGDSAQLNGSAMTDINFLDSSTIAWTRDTTPNPDTAVAAVVAGSITPTQLASQTFGLFTCNGTTCSVNNDTVALGTKTTGTYVAQLQASSPLTSSVGCNAETGTCIVTFDQTANMSLSGRVTYSGSLVIPETGSPPAANLCDETAEYGSIYADLSAPTGSALNYCTATGWKTAGGSTVSVNGASISAPNFKNTGAVTFNVSGSDITPAMNADAVALGTGTTGNYVASVTGTGHISPSGCSPAEGAACSLSLSGVDSGDMASTLDFSGKTFLLIPVSATPTTNAIGQISFDSNAQASAHGSIQLYDGTSNTYVVAVRTSSNPQNGYVPIWQTGGIVDWGAQSVTPAGSSSELQYRAGPTTVGAVSGTTVSGGNITMTGTHTAATLTASNTTVAPGNRFRLTSNDTDLTPDPTCANSGTTNLLTIIDKDESASDTWVICDGTTELLNLSVPSIGLTNLTTAAKVKTNCVSVSVMAQNIFVFKIPASVTGNAVRVSCVSSGTVTTAPTYTLQECATDGSSCSSVHASPITCGATEGTTGTFTDSSWAASAWMRILSGNTGIVAGMTQFCVDWTPS